MKRNKTTFPALVIASILAITSCSITDTDYSYKLKANDIVTTTNFDIDDDFTINFTNTFNNIFDTSISTYIPQGITRINDFTLVTAYDYNQSSNSVVYVFDQSGNLFNKCSLSNTAHVGGIAHDKKNNLLWITGTNGKIDAYDPKKVLLDNEVIPIYSDLNVGEGLKCYADESFNAVSFLSIDDDILYVGNYSINKNALLKAYSIEVKDNRIRLELIDTYQIPDKVQGVAFYTDKDFNKHMLLSRSDGRFTNSIIQVFDFDRDDHTYLDNPSFVYETQPMIEQILIDDDYLYSLYEINALPYRTNNDNNKTLTLTKIDKII